MLLPLDRTRANRIDRGANKPTRRSFLETSLKAGVVSVALPAFGRAAFSEPVQPLEAFELDVSFLQWLERPRRSNAQSLCARPKSLRIRLRRSGLRESLHRSDWHRNRRLDRLSFVRQRHRRYQTHRRTHQPCGNYPDRTQPRHRWSQCRSVADAALLLGVLSSIDPDDPATKARPTNLPSDYTQFLDRSGLRGARIGVVRASYNFTESTGSVFSAAVEAMRHEGALLIDPVEVPSAEKFMDSELQVLLHEFKADLNSFLAAALNVPVHSLKDIIDFNEAHSDRELQFFGQDLFLNAEKKGPLTDEAYVRALAKNHRCARMEGIDAAMGQISPRRPSGHDRRSFVAHRSDQR